MVHRTVPRFVLVSLCLCVLANFSWAQHGAGSHAGGGGFSAHAGGGFSSHASAGPSFGGQSGFHPAPSRVPGSFYGSPFSHRGPFAPYPFRGPGHLVRPNTGFQHFRSYSRPAAGPRVAQGRVPRSAYLGARNPHYASPVRSHGPTAGPWRSFAGGPSSNRGAGRRTPLSPINHGPMHLPGRPPVLPPNGVFFNPIFVNAFFFPHPFFFTPFFFPTFTWWWYPPLTFSDFGCPYEDYYHQQQPYYYQPEEGPSEQPSTGEAEQRSEAPKRRQTFLPSRLRNRPLLSHLRSHCLTSLNGVKPATPGRTTSPW